MSRKSIADALSHLRWRERYIALAWGIARWAALATVCLAIVAAIDWYVEQRHDMSRSLRSTLAGLELATLAVAAVAWIIVPVFRRRSDDTLALYVESHRPDLAHRLISAVQLGRIGARVEGMSPELVTAVIAEAQRDCAREDFISLLDHRRIVWAGLLGAACIVVLAGMTATELGRALVARQFLVGSALPRRVRIEDRTKSVQPTGEPIELRFAVSGNPPFDGEIYYRSDGVADRRVGVRAAAINGVVTVVLPETSGDIEYEARIGDARLDRPGRVKLVSRPAVLEMHASVLLPEYLGRRADGSRYSRPQPTGDVIGIADCAASIAASCPSDVAKAEVEILGRRDSSDVGPLIVVRRIPMRLPTPREALAQFDLQPGETAYRVTVYDSLGFRNLDPPRRDIHLLAEEPPAISLLPEQFRPTGDTGPAAEDFGVDGVPVPLGSALRVGYAAHHPFGLGRAYFVYRVVPGVRHDGSVGTPASHSPRPSDGEWKRLPLSESVGASESGPFDPRRGCFANSLAGDQVQFHAMTDGGGIPRADAGGRFDFQTRALKELNVGDQVEYFIEVTNADPEKPLVGRSEIRVKRIVTVADLVAWIDGVLRQEERIRRLAERQKSVFKSQDNPSDAKP